MLKKLAIAAVAIVVAIVAVGLARGSEWRVEKSIGINAKPENIQPLITDFAKGWPQWSLWSSMDPAAKYKYSGTPGTPGHSMTWSGPEVGNGTLTLQTVEPLKVVFAGAIEAKEQNDVSTFSFSDDGKTTTLVWLDEGKAPPVIGGLFKGLLEKTLGAQFEKNLEQLKVAAEKKQTEIDAAAAAAAAAGAAAAAAVAPTAATPDGKAVEVPKER